MFERISVTLLAVFALLGAAHLMAQGQGGTPSTSNPTPGTPQPDPPKLANRITLTGCLQAAPASGRSSQTVEPSTKSDSRFVLNNAQREDVVPAGTGTAIPASAPVSRSYKLDGIESQLAPFVGTKVQVSGELEPPAASARTSATAVPTLHVGFIQKMAATCQ